MAWIFALRWVAHVYVLKHHTDALLLVVCLFSDNNLGFAAAGILGRELPKCRLRAITCEGVRCVMWWPCHLNLIFTMSRVAVSIPGLQENEKIVSEQSAELNLYG